MTIVDIFEKMESACSLPCEVSISKRSESLEFRWRFELDGRWYGYCQTVSIDEIVLARNYDDVFELIFDKASSVMTCICKEVQNDAA